MAAKNNDGTKPDLSAALPDGMVPSDSDVDNARKDGAIQAIKDQAADTYKAATDGALPGEVMTDPYLGSDESQQYAYMLDNSPDEFDKLVNRDNSPVTDVRAAGLLKLERNGRNRTPYVKTLLKRLDLKGEDIGKVADGGPAYTNDMSNISDL